MKKHDFSRGNRCHNCGANIYLAAEECSNDMSAYEDYLYEESQEVAS